MPDGAGFHDLVPPRSLRDRVWSLWLQQTPGHHLPQRQRTVPDGSVRLVCRLGGAVELWGARTNATTRDLDPGATVVGARFHPWEARSLGGPSAAELRNQTVPAGEALGSWADELGERLSGMGSGRAAVALLGAELGRRLACAEQSAGPVAFSVRRMLARPLDPVATSIAAAGVSARHLRRRFEHEVGLSPKELQRQLRFQLVLAQVNDGLDADSPRLASVAHRAGFTDQAHLSHECLRLTGVPPSKFVAETRHRCAEGHHHGAAFAPLNDPA